MLQVKKRDNNVVPFDLSKIENAIEKAFIAVGKCYTKDIIELLSLKVTAAVSDKVSDGVVSVEDVQDSVEVVLIQASYVDVAKAYILYRKNHEKMRNMSSTVLDYKATVGN